MSISEFERINKETYSTPEAVEIYSREYLWPYEKFFLEKYIKPGDKVLDVGCGTGRSTRYIAEKTPNVIGIDMSVPFIEQGRRLYPNLDLRVMNASQLNFDDTSFDVVFFSNQGIDYTEKRIEILKECHRLVKPGGTFAYSSHNSLALPRSLSAWTRFFRNIYSWRPGYHIRREHHSNGELYVAHTNVWAETRVIEKIGFSVVDILSNVYPRSHKPKIITGLCTRWPLYVCRKNIISYK